MESLLKTRLKLAIKLSGKSARAISIEATGKPDALRDILRGKVISPRSDTLRKLAKYLGTDVAYLTGTSDAGSPQARESAGDLILARVVGSVQAGAFMELSDQLLLEVDPKYIPTVRDPDFPELEQIAFEVVGDSIDRACVAGGYAIGIPFNLTGLVMKDGMWVVADRVRGSLVERTIKQVRVVDGQFELHPKSSNPKHKPINFPSAEAHEEVTIFAVIRRFLSPLLRS